MIGAVLMSLLVIAPVFSDDGELEFRVVEDGEKADGSDDKVTSKTQQWVKQGGKVGIRLTDADLNVVIKNVLLPSDMNKVGDNEATTTVATVVAGENVITVEASGKDKDKKLSLAIGDTVLVNRTDVEQTVREVTAIGDPVSASTTIFKVTVNKAFDKDATEVPLYKVTTASAEASKCLTCAMAESFTLESSSRKFTLGNRPVDSGIADAGAGPNNRFSEDETDGDLSEIDVLIVKHTEPKKAVSTVDELHSTGRIDFVPELPEGKYYALYWSNTENTSRGTVKVSSGQSNSGISVILRESANNSGVFEYILMTREPKDEDEDGKQDPDTTATGLTVSEDDTITVVYTDPASGDSNQTATIQVETTAPDFSGIAPTNGSAAKAQRQEVEVDVTDAGSGIASAKNIWVVFSQSSDGKKVDGTQVQNVDEDGTSTNIDNGFNISMTNDERVDDITLFWWVVAEDVAGNIGVSDRVTQHKGADSECMADTLWTTLGRGKVEEPSGLTGKSVEITHVEDSDPEMKGDQPKNSSVGVSGCQPYTIRIDNTSPKMTNAHTGEFWDTSQKLAEGETDYTSKDKSKPESIRVVFDEKLDGSTVSADDFEVDGSVPSAADFYTDLPDSVFLTVPTLDANDRPSVELVGEVTDRAGNKRKGTKLAKAKDAIAPTLTVTLEGSFGGGDRVLTDKEITVTIEADESISAPTVVISRMKDADSTKADLDEEKSIDLDKNGGQRRTASQVKGQKNKYSTKFTVATAGLYSVYVSATDTSGGNNDGTLGAQKTPVNISKDTKDLLFEVDTGIASFDVTPDKTDDPKAFITLDYSGEGNEYLDKDTDYDSFSKLTIVEATLIDPDGEKTNITDALNASANSAGTKFRYNDPDGLAMGKYKLEVKAKDEAGNESKSAQKGDFEVEKRAPFKVELAPGSNFISFPSDPHDTDINKVIPADHPIARVLTYDPKVPGGWLTAVRGEDGMFEGTLKELTARRAYIITTDSFDALEVSIPKPSASAAAFLPSLDLSKGWNLVPIIDIDGNNKLQGDLKHTENAPEVDGKMAYKKGDPVYPNYDYFGSAKDDISVIYTFKTQTNEWSSVEGGEVVLGKGYWVYATKSVTLIPK